MLPELIGYADRWSVQPGERVRFMVSTDQPDYEATIVRLIHGDENPNGPGFKEAIVATLGSKQGRKQTSYTGSYVKIEHHPVLNLNSFTLQAWIYPTTPEKNTLQGIIAKWSQTNEAGYRLVIGTAGSLELHIGDGQGKVERVTTGKPLRKRCWYFLAAIYDAQTGTARLYQQPLTNYPNDPSLAVVEATLSIAPAVNDAPLLIAAAYGETVAAQRLVGKGTYNGKIDRPCLFAHALDDAAIDHLQGGVAPSDISLRDLVAAWDFYPDSATNRVHDTGRHRLHGVAVNTPGRAMMGHNWSSTVIDHKAAPHEYGAIHFHEEDIEDSGWEADFDWSVPGGTRSGFYAARLRSGNLEDYLPFWVRPQRGKAHAPVAFLVPTYTYHVYSNLHFQFDQPHDAGVTDRPIVQHAVDNYFNEHPEHGLSIYDKHGDGSGCMYSSRLRPMISLRPKYRFWLTSAPRHLGADLSLIDWLETKGFDYDVLTDEDLHFEGKELLDNYRVIITGSHPEYWTMPMINALEAYLNDGGRLMYLGGNGFYWVTGVDPERPHILEVRRGMGGSRDWSSEPGELYLSTTGELGGLWRHRGKAPNQIAGIGFSGMGWDKTAGYYVRQPGSFDPRATFIFDEINDDELIGNFGLVLGGAAGDELDRMDFSLGTPPHALLLASSTGHSPFILPVIEDFGQINASLITHLNATAHADMIYFETPNNGAVFSTGSITWCGSLSHNNYENNVSRITENVLRKFQS